MLASPATMGVCANAKQKNDPLRGYHLMSFLLENYWFWIMAAVIVAVVGYVVFLNDRKPRTLGMGLGAVLLVLALGSVLYFCVDTDRKSISRTIASLATNIENDARSIIGTDFGLQVSVLGVPAAS